MAGIIFDLAEVLTDQKTCYEGLLTLANYKEEAVKDKNLDVLSQVVQREEEFIGRVSLLDRKRESIIKDVALVMGMDARSLTLTQLIHKLNNQAEITQQLTILREDILTLMEQLKKQNTLNTTLLQQSLELVNFTVNALQSTQVAAPHANYSRPGQAETLETRSFFDIKQ